MQPQMFQRVNIKMTKGIPCVGSLLSGVSGGQQPRGGATTCWTARARGSGGGAGTPPAATRRPRCTDGFGGPSSRGEGAARPPGPSRRAASSSPCATSARGAGSVSSFLDVQEDAPGLPFPRRAPRQLPPRGLGLGTPGTGCRACERPPAPRPGIPGQAPHGPHARRKLRHPASGRGGGACYGYAVQ